jgi:hypothetical protein
MPYTPVLIFILLIFLSSCGGGTQSQTPAELPETPSTTQPSLPTETLIYGHFDIVLEDNIKRSIFLGPNNSFLYSNVSNNNPPTELICQTSNTLEPFTTILKTQTLIFDCLGSSENGIIITLELEDSLQITYEADITESMDVLLDDIVKLDTPKLKDSVPTVQGITDRSRTENYIRDIFLASTSSDNTGRYFVIIRSIDKITEGRCTVGYEYDFSVKSISVNDLNETAYLYPKQIREQPSLGTCEDQVLPMPRIDLMYTLFAQIYSLEDNSFFIVIDNSNFLTMGKLITP